MLSDRQILLRGKSAHAHEQEALEFIRQALPDSPNLLVWELVELADPNSGRLHEIDVLILGYWALYLVEIKSGPGIYTGDTVDWQRQAPGEPARTMDPPTKLTNFKAKVLKSMLERQMDSRSVPWVQPLVFLSHPDAKLQFRNFGDQFVVSRRNFAKAITHHEFPGSEGPKRARVNAPQAKALAGALSKIGVRESKGTLRVGTYELGNVLESGPGYEDRLAVHTENRGMKRRARSYLVPEQTSVERRAQLRRAANRESQLLEDVKGHPNILRISDYVSDAPLGPTVLFDHFEGTRLDAFLRQAEVVSFSDRVELIGQIGRALEHCHKKAVYHGSLSPSAVLVGRKANSSIDCRLYNFQLGGGEQVSHTMHWSALAEENWGAYQAPELRENPAAPRDVADVFSLGALAYFVLTGKAPAASALEADLRLRHEHHFDPAAVDDGLSDGVAECIRMATSWRPINRFESAEGFVELLYEEATATATAPSAPEINPLEAKKGDELAGLRVLGVLGQGASSRVLQVERVSDGRQCALKVALNEQEDARLEEEAALLRPLRHQRIVQLYDAPTLGGRKCLLLALAGTETLQRRLKQEGLVSLDYAARFGEDLLLALEQLQEDRLLHRDIKPANVGVGPVSKQAHHLMLFDFSLGLKLNAQDAPTHGISQLGLGTTAYRDPYLVDRGAWDYAADRWSAAVTLHEMLTGTRPSWEPTGASARDPEAKLVLAAERFDASVRDRLTDFFRKALQPEVTARHADAAHMRQAWIVCFAAPAVSPTVVTATGRSGASTDQVVPPAENSVETFDYASVVPAAPLGALPLSSRALNALDRAGVTSAGELARLPDNRLSAVRGVGKQVVVEVVDVKERWRAAHSEPSQDEEAFFPGYGGADLTLSACELTAPLVRVFSDAGLSTLASIAAAPKTQIARLAERAASEGKVLSDRLQREQVEEEQRAHPSSVDGWLRSMLPKSKKRTEHLKVIFGLSGPLAGKTDVLVAHAARVLKLTAPALYIALGKAKEDWLTHPALHELQATAHDVVTRAGGAAPVERAALALLEKYPATPQLGELFDGVAPERQPVVAAAALLRIVGIVEKDQEDGLCWERLDAKRPWLLASDELAQALLKLGAAADDLARREVIAASGETIRVLRSVAEGTPFAQLSDERLTELAADASERAARSSRLELYPRGLSAARAIGLSWAALTGKLSADQVQQRVQARYPEAEALPPRPELDQLLAGGLLWNDDTQFFERPEERHQSNQTHFGSSLPTLTTHQRTVDPRCIAASDFHERVQIALERGRFRVLAVRTDVALDNALALRDRFALKLVNLDERLLQAAQTLIAQHGVDQNVVFAADRLGAASADWPQLCGLMQGAAEQVLTELLASKAPLLLVNPGLLARYRLDDFLRRLVHNTRQPDAQAVFLLVPGADQPGVPRINGTLSIPEVGEPDALMVPSDWAITIRKAS